MAWVAPQFCQLVTGGGIYYGFACVTTNHANKRAVVSAQNSRYEFATLQLSCRSTLVSCDGLSACLHSTACRTKARALHVNEGTHAHDASAHMLTMPMHTCSRYQCTHAHDANAHS